MDNCRRLQLLGWMFLKKDERSEQLYKPTDNFDFTFWPTLRTNVKTFTDLNHKPRQEINIPVVFSFLKSYWIV